MKINKLVKSKWKPNIKMLIYGDPGVGKTVFAGHAEKALIVDVEAGLASLLDREPEFITIREYPEINAIFSFLDEAEHDYETVVIDSLTELSKKAMDYILEQGIRLKEEKDEFMPTMRDWTKNNQMIRKVVRKFRDLPMNVIFTAIKTQDKDEETGGINYRPSLNPSVVEDVMGYVDIVGYLFVDEQEIKGQEQLVRRMLFQPAGKYRAKDRFGKLGTVIDNPNFPQILNILKG